MRHEGRGAFNLPRPPHIAPGPLPDPMGQEEVRSWLSTCGMWTVWFVQAAPDEFWLHAAARLGKVRPVCRGALPLGEESKWSTNVVTDWSRGRFWLPSFPRRPCCAEHEVDSGSGELWTRHPGAVRIPSGYTQDYAQSTTPGWRAQQSARCKKRSAGPLL